MKMKYPLDIKEALYALWQGNMVEEKTTYGGLYRLRYPRDLRMYAYSGGHWMDIRRGYISDFKGDSTFRIVENEDE